MFPALIITYDTITLLPVVTLSFVSSKEKPLLATKFTCSTFFQKIDNTTFKVKGLLDTQFTFAFSALNHEDITGEVTITQQEETKEYSATYIPMRTIRVLKRNTTIFIPGATIKIGDETYTASSTGQIQIRKNVSLSGTVEANDYNDGSFDLEAIADDTTNIVYLDPQAVVTFTVRDDKSNLLSGATVTVGGKSATTNSSGVCTIALKKGTYTYVAKYQNYQGGGSFTLGLSNISVSASVLLDISSMKPEENGNIQLLLSGTAATLNVTSPNTDYVIDWGDGTTENASGTGAKTYNHTYSDANYYQVEVYNCAEVTRCNGTASCTIAYWNIGDSKVANLSFSSFSRIEYIDDLWKNDTDRASFYQLCYYCERLKIIKFDSLVTNTVVKDCSYLLFNCKKLTSINLTPLAGWINVTNCRSLVSGTSITSIDLTPLSYWINVSDCAMLLRDTSLTSIDLSPLASWVKVTECFYLLLGCSMLTSVDLTPLASWVNVIDASYMLEDCSGLTSVDLTPLVKWTKILSSGRLISGCSNLTYISILDIPPFTLSSGALTNGNSCPIYVLDAAVDTYKTATNWSAYADRIKPISEKPAA